MVNAARTSTTTTAPTTIPMIAPFANDELRPRTAAAIKPSVESVSSKDLNWLQMLKQEMMYPGHGRCNHVMSHSRWSWQRD